MSDTGLFNLLNPRPPKGFFGQTGAGISQGLGGLGTAAGEILAPLLANDEADAADIGVAAFLHSLGAPFARKQQQEDEQRQRVSQLLPQILPMLTPESQQSSIQALLGTTAPGIQLQKPVLTPEQELQLGILKQAQPESPAGKMQNLSRMLGTFMKPEEAANLASETYKEDVAQADIMKGRETQIHDLNVQNMQDEIAQRQRTYNLQVSQLQMDALSTMLKDDSISFSAKMKLMPQMLVKAGMPKAQANEIAATSFAPQLRTEASSMLYDEMIVGGKEWKDVPQNVRDMALAAGIKEPTTAEGMASLKLRLRTSGKAAKLSKDEVFATQLLDSIGLLDTVRTQALPGETDEQTLRRVLPGEAETHINVLREGGILADRGKEFQTLSETYKTQSEALQMGADMGEDTSAIRQLMQATQNMMWESRAKEMAVTPEAGTPGAEAKPKDMWNPEELSMAILQDRNENVSDRPVYRDWRDIVKTMSDTLGVDVSKVPEYVKAAKDMEPNLVIRIPTPIRRRMAQLATPRGVSIDALDLEFQQRYNKAFVNPNQPPSTQSIALQMLTELQSRPVSPETLLMRGRP